MATKVELLEKAKELGLEISEDATYNDIQKAINEAEADKKAAKSSSKKTIHYVPEYGVNVYAKNSAEAVEKAKELVGIKE